MKQGIDQLQYKQICLNYITFKKQFQYFFQITFELQG